MNKIVIYVNGVLTDAREAELHRRALSDVLGFEAVAHYNPTCGPLDFIEAFWNRWGFRFYSTRVVQDLAFHIEELLEQDEFLQVYLVAHSQGTAIAMNAARLLDPIDQANVNLILFAPVMNGDVPPELRGRVESWVCLDDMVMSLSGNVFAKAFRRLRRWWTGKVDNPGQAYYRTGGGHGFVAEYLNQIEQFGGYQNSMFWRLKRGGEG